jgi:arginase family enzyme
MDVLDPEEVPDQGLTVPGGPSSEELGEALELMFEHPQAAAFGVASYPWDRDPDGTSLKAVYTLIKVVMRGLRSRRLLDD